MTHRYILLAHLSLKPVWKHGERRDGFFTLTSLISSSYWMEHSSWHTAGTISGSHLALSYKTQNHCNKKIFYWSESGCSTWRATVSVVTLTRCLLTTRTRTVKMISQRSVVTDALYLELEKSHRRFFIFTHSFDTRSTRDCVNWRDGGISFRALLRSSYTFSFFLSLCELRRRFFVCNRYCAFQKSSEMYHLVPIILAIQATMFYLPNFIWLLSNKLSGTLVTQIEKIYSGFIQESISNASLLLQERCSVCLLSREKFLPKWSPPTFTTPLSQTDTSSNAASKGWKMLY